MYFKFTSNIFPVINLKTLTREAVENTQTLACALRVMDNTNRAISLTRHSFCVRAFSSGMSRTCELPPHLGPLDDQDLINWIASFDDRIDITASPDGVSNSGKKDRIDIVTTVTLSSPDVASNCGKKLQSKYIRDALLHWMTQIQDPYMNIEQKKHIATALNIPVAQVSNFCNNHRKRYFKFDNKMTSYSKCRMMLYGQAP
jgi:hypothetical protein